MVHYQQVSCVMFLFLMILWGPTVTADPINASNVHVESEIDLRHQLVHFKTAVTFKNWGPTKMMTYQYYPEPDLFLLSFTKNGSDLNYENCNSTMCVDVILDFGVAPNEECTIIAQATYANKITPVYKNRRQDDPQYVLYKGSLKFVSPYPTQYYSAKYIFNKLPNEYSVLPAHETENEAVFEFNNIPRLSHTLFDIVFENDNPFLLVNSLHRIIYVSHFDKILIRDTVQLENNGPQLTGEYHNTKYLAQPRAATTWLYTHLPASATDIQFYDDLGNNSQSQVFQFEDYVTLKFSSRYPLLGSWKTSYVIEYYVSTHEYLFTDNRGFFSLSIRAIDHVLDDKMIKESQTKIVLPEGSQIRLVTVPPELTWIRNETDCFGGLCIVGRPSLILEGHNLFPLPTSRGVLPVIVNYTLHYGFLVKSPILIIFYLQCCFVIYVFYRLCVLQVRKRLSA